MCRLYALGIEISQEKQQGPSEEVKFLGVRWVGGRKEIPQDVLEDLWDLSDPADKKSLRGIIGTLGFWRQHRPGFRILA